MAPDFYPAKGRKGRKMTGAVSRDANVRYRKSQGLTKWLRLFREINGRAPSATEARSAVERGAVASDVARWASLIKVRRTRLYCPIPLGIIEKIQTGRIGKLKACEIFGLTEEKLEDYLHAFNIQWQ